MQSRKTPRLDAKPLVIGQVEMKDVELHRGHRFDEALHEVNRQKTAGRVDHHATPAKSRVIANLDRWNVIAVHQLKERRRAPNPSLSRSRAHADSRAIDGQRILFRVSRLVLKADRAALPNHRDPSGQTMKAGREKLRGIARRIDGADPERFGEDEPPRLADQLRGPGHEVKFVGSTQARRALSPSSVVSPSTNFTLPP